MNSVETGQTTQPIYASSWRLNRRWRFNPRLAAQTSLLHVLEMAVTPGSPRQCPLSAAELIELYAREETGSARRRARALARRLAREEALPEALEQIPDLLTDLDVLAIRVGSQTGILPATLRTLREDKQRQIVESWRAGGSFLVYFLCILGVLLLLTAIIRGYILPMFHQIATEFNSPLPETFRWLTNPWVDWLLTGIPLVLLVGLMAAWLITKTRLSRWLRRSVVSFVSWRHFRVRCAQTLRLIAASLRAGRPGASALSSLARFHFDPWIRFRLLQARNDLELGTPLAASLRDVRLLSPDQAAALQLLDDGAEQGWLLEQIAERIESTLQRRDRLVKSLIQPLLLCLIGLMVLVVCVAVISTMSTWVLTES